MYSLLLRWLNLSSRDLLIVRFTNHCWLMLKKSNPFSLLCWWKAICPRSILFYFKALRSHIAFVSGFILSAIDHTSMAKCIFILKVLPRKAEMFYCSVAFSLCAFSDPHSCKNKILCKSRDVSWILSKSEMADFYQSFLSKLSQVPGICNFMLRNPTLKEYFLII